MPEWPQTEEVASQGCANQGQGMRFLQGKYQRHKSLHEVSE